MHFSIAMPVCRQAHFLPLALKSIRAQAQDVELAVMDATPDSSVLNVLEEYRDLLSYHRHGADEGQASAIQEGWNNTHGEILAWLCADDYYFPYTLDEVKKAFTSHPDVDVIYGDSVLVDEDGRFLKYFPTLDGDISSILEGCCISQPSCFVRRTALERVGSLNSTLHYTMDWDLWTRLYRSGEKFHYLNKPLSVVRMYKGTKTSSRSLRRFLEIGRHLYRNAPLAIAAKSLLGFYYEDLSTCQVTGLERFLLKLLQFFHRQKRRLKSSKGVGDRCNYGLSQYQNTVQAQTVVYLPWYKQVCPVAVKISCDLEIAPEIYLNGIKLSVKNGSRFYCEIPPLDLPLRLLELRLSSQANGIWHLHGVAFE